MKTHSGKSITSIESEPIHVTLKPIDQHPKIPERYPFSLVFKFTAGKEERQEQRLQPSVTFRPEHLVSNVRQPHLAFLRTLLCGNMNGQIGQEAIDLNCAPDIADPILGVPVSFQWVSPANFIHMIVDYTGRIPAGMKGGKVFEIVVTLVGSAALLT